MAKAEHLKILEKGVSVWNDWRKDNPDVRPDLSETNFSDADLSKTDLSKTDLSNADLRKANLRKANLSLADLSFAYLSLADLREADLSFANLSNADLIKADLRKALLSDANFSNANLRDANLSNANLSYVNLSDANLKEANFSEAVLGLANFSNSFLFKTKFNKAHFGYTTITSCDLQKTLGLSMVRHLRPSSIGLDTIFNSKGKIPLTFLKGCGVDEEVAKYLLKEARTKMHYSCFISYSSKDEKFAKKLKKDLELKNIKCWFFPEDATWGKDTFKNIDLAIKTHDKLIIICSKNSLNSEPVLREIERAIQEEKARKEKDKETERVMFPVVIDNYFYNEWEHYLKPDLLKITIGDFRNWKDLREYKKALLKLVKSLQK